MTQFYSDPTRKDDTYSLPDAEVFYLDEGEQYDDEGEALPEGWYYWYCFPGCLPDSDPIGPFESEQSAITDAEENNTF